MAKTKLYIDTEEITDVTEFHSEVKGYSITPKTFQSRKLFSKIDNEILNFTKGAKDIINVAYEKADAIRNLIKENNIIVEKGHKMGIFSEGECKGLQANDAKFQLLNTKLTEVNNDRTKFEFVLNNTTYCVNENVIYEDIYENSSGNKVVRYGLNTVELNEFAITYNKNWLSNPHLYHKEASQSQGKKSGKSEKNESSDKILSFIEIISIQKAFQNMQLSAAKTALIDIFEKDEKGQISFNSKTKLPETHTIVLYKNSDKDFVVIDPTDSSYSTHIASDINKMLIGSDVSISTSQKNVQIYFPKKDQTGSNLDQYRDCIDIAVKLAFGLNNYSKKVDPAKIAELPIVKEISNFSTINDSLPNEIIKDKKADIPLRTQQKSDTKIGEKLYQFSKVIKDNLGELEDKKNLDKEYIEKLKSNNQKPNELLNSLYEIGNVSFELIHEELKQKQISSLGNNFNPDDYMEE